MEATLVRYEILKSFARGNGVLALHIHDVGFAPRGLFGGGLLSPAPLGTSMLTPSPGPNPLDSLAYAIDRSRAVVKFYVRGIDRRWYLSTPVEPVRLISLPWLASKRDSGTLAGLFQSYGWKSQNGYQRFPSWVEAAAVQVGR